MHKRTKIVATIGPASESNATLDALMKNGLNVARLNFSHGDFAEHQLRVDRIRALSKKHGRPIGILQDLSGPKIRIGDFQTETVTLKKGAKFILTTDKLPRGTVERVHIKCPRLEKELKKGDVILLDDGKKRLEVESVHGKDIVTKVKVGGVIKGRRGVNLPGAYLSISSLTKKDKADIAFGIQNDVDFFALSFVRRARDIEDLRRILEKNSSNAMIIAKIETEEAVEHIDEIIKVADGIMVARGDLAVEVPNEKVPMIQKDIIRKCNNIGKPVITATQMLESMITAPVPTRAEVSDIANAIIDGTDAVMLSGETAQGEYPVEAIEVMARVARETEKKQHERMMLENTNTAFKIANSITRSVVHTSHDVSAQAIVALTGSGFTARMIARHKPEPIIFALSSNERITRQLTLSYGCVPRTMKKTKDFFSSYKQVCAQGIKERLFKKGDTIVVAAGVSYGGDKALETNMLLVEKV